MSGRAFPQQIGNLLRSPMAMMPLWIVAGTALYTLGWSRLFEPFRLDTLAFLAIAALLFVALATTSRMEVDARPGASLDRWALTVIGVYFVGAYIENGGIPVIQIATGDDYDVYGFGVDGLHIFMLCFTGFYGVRAWHVFLTRGGMWNLAALAGIGGLLLSIGNRSAFSFLVFACAVVFVRLRRISAPVWAGVILAAIIFAFGFGKFGDFRLSYQIEQATGEPGAPDAVLALARATDGFRESGLSPSWLWTYMYFASPLANLNSAFNLSGGRPCGQGRDRREARGDPRNRRSRDHGLSRRTQLDRIYRLRHCSSRRWGGRRDDDARFPGGVGGYVRTSTARFPRRGGRYGNPRDGYLLLLLRKHVGIYAAFGTARVPSRASGILPCAPTYPRPTSRERASPEMTTARHPEGRRSRSQQVAQRPIRTAAAPCT